MWHLGYPEAALADADHALQDARELSQAATLMLALSVTAWTQIFCGNYAAATSRESELVALADEKGAAWWKALGTWSQGVLFVLTGNASDAVQMITSGLTAYRAAGATAYVPLNLSYLATAYADLGRFDDAWRSVDEALTAVETTKERIFEAEVNRVAGEIALKSPRYAGKALAYFERALEVARAQQAKSWELRTAMSMARLWRDQGKPQQARELLAPV
jgi:predicted ATPase